MNDLSESPSLSRSAAYVLRMTSRALAGLIVAAALLTFGAAHADITDTPPQTCTSGCAVSKVAVNPRAWSDRQWVVVGRVSRNHERYAHQELWLQSLQPGGWVTQAKAVAGQDGRAIFTLDAFSGRPDNLWRIRFPGNATTLYDDSPTFSIPS